MTQRNEIDLGLDPELMAYVDGVLPPEKMAEVEARLAHDSDAREAVSQWRHFDNLLHQHAREADELPASLGIAALERELVRKLQRRQWRARLMGPGLQRIAASVLLFAGGWLAHGYYSEMATQQVAQHPYFVAPTLAGHSSYVLASQQSAEFTGDKMTEALAWMSERMQQKIDSPKLERLGYQVESARLVVVQDQPVAVFYYRNPADQLVTVSMTPRLASQPDYALRVRNVDASKMAYWTSDHMHYVVVSDTDTASITSLAAAVR
jgi:anti-sigma factor RsiW